MTNLSAKWIKHFTTNLGGVAIVEVGGNEFALQTTKQKEKRSNCYIEWDNEVLVVSSTCPMTQEVVETMLGAGVFGRGQEVDATLNADGTIHYWGLCDSGD